MIRNFELFCNLKNVKQSESVLFKHSLDSFSPDNTLCPSCGAKGAYNPHGSYERYLIHLLNAAVTTETITVPRLKCACGHTHALLPACLIPYGSYSLFFILTVLRAYFLCHQTVALLCESFGISISTLYAWIRLYHTHKSLWLGILNNLETTSLDFLALLRKTPDFLPLFFGRMAFSFLQGMSFTPPSRRLGISNDS